MNLQNPNWKSIAETIGTVAIVVGLLLVFIELRQGQIIARAEPSAHSGEIFTEIRNRELDPEFAALMLKGRKNPSELTEIERMQLNAHLTQLLGLYFREKYNYDRGIFESYEDYPSLSAVEYFGSGYGRAYWEARKGRYVPELVRVVDAALTDEDTMEYVDTLDDRTRSHIDN